MFGIKKLFTVNKTTVQDKLADALGIFNTAKAQLQEVVFSANTELLSKDEEAKAKTEAYEKFVIEYNASIDQIAKEAKDITALKEQAITVITNIENIIGTNIKNEKEDEDGRNC